jgi:hypothetical protein
MSDSPECPADQLSRLRELGFECAGRVERRDAGIAIIIDDPAVRSASPTMYAFVVAERVMYIGKSERTLGQRMQNYCNPGPTQPTNTRVRGCLMELLARDAGPTVWVWRDPGTMSYRGLVMDAAAGLESAVIRLFQPPWNSRGTGRGPPPARAQASNMAAERPSARASQARSEATTGCERSHADQILAVLAAHAGPASSASLRSPSARHIGGYCDDCIAARAGIAPRQAVNATARKLELERLLRREKEHCARCGKTKVCNRRV